MGYIASTFVIFPNNITTPLGIFPDISTSFGTFPGNIVTTFLIFSGNIAATFGIFPDYFVATLEINVSLKYLIKNTHWVI